MRCIACGNRLGYKFTFEDLLVLHQSIHMSCLNKLLNRNHFLLFYIGDTLVKHVYFNTLKHPLYKANLCCIQYGDSVYLAILEKIKDSIVLWMEEDEFINLNSYIWRFLLPLTKKQVILCSIDQYHVG